MYQTIAILGGSGFVGRQLAAQLGRDGKQLLIPSRHPERHRALHLLPGVQVLRADIHNPSDLNGLLAHCDAVINLVGILNESGHDGSGFQRAHVELTHKLLHACRTPGVQRLLHMSAFNADPQGPSHYLRSKGEAEQLLRQANDLAVTLFRPSVIFGPDDSFFNRFAALLRVAPCCFPLACPNARFAPVWVNDVATAMVQTLHDPASHGQAYDLCGPTAYSLQQLVAYTAQACGLSRRILPLNDRLSYWQAWLLEYVPGKPFSLDNYASLQVPSVCQDNGLARLGITPHSLESLVPGYLSPCHQRAHYGDLRAMARR